MPIERHPFEPFCPAGAKVLIMGTFPPKSVRWSMNFYYPNRINDFWRIMGLIFLGSGDALYDAKARMFRLEMIKELLTDKGIALNDTGRAVRRLRDNASDKWLEIVEPVPLGELLERMPECHALATTGEKAGRTLAEITGSELPKIGEFVHAAVEGGREVEIWRMPSTSRAYPLSLEKKAEAYAHMFRSLGIPVWSH